jgi:hypothetical protein
MIKIDYILWDADKKKIHRLETITLTETDIIEMMLQRYHDGQLPVPIHLNKDEIVAEFNVSGVSF